MRIYYDKRLLMLGKITLNYSPNFSSNKRIKKNIKYLIFHYTGMNSETKAINRLTNDKNKVSAHYFVKKNGKIISMVPDLYIAWHAGKSKWKNFSLLNKYSIGIEISNNGHDFGYQNFTKNQIETLFKLSKHLIKKFKISKKNILGHSDIAYNRKKDPGEKFPWKYLAKKKIGIWHNLDTKKLYKNRKIKIEKKEELKFINFLKIIGYYTKKISLLEKTKLLYAFQRRFRPELIDGKIDKECLIIAEKLSKLYS